MILQEAISMKYFTIGLFIFFSAACGSPEKKTVEPSGKPNIILIVSDDQGVADTGFSGLRDIRTPNIDKTSNETLIFSKGYVSHSYCSQSRTGILTGRHQQRFGHELKPPYKSENEIIGLPFDEILISDELKKAGCRIGAIGKWHLGYTHKHLPQQRGFDFWYGFSVSVRSFRTTGKPVENQAQKLGTNNSYVSTDKERLDRCNFVCTAACIGERKKIIKI